MTGQNVIKLMLMLIRSSIGCIDILLNPVTPKWPCVEHIRKFGLKFFLIKTFHDYLLIDDTLNSQSGLIASSTVD